ncbi:MAG: methylated-DNA--[protein]-cysteine S-methyltransferase [Firmicutes bacterium]|uniref:methylated-DNA--[protein]-cysteine S-methyltransferase n=1 Tax=Candidatus Onthovivens merdipullorum TaxID=2840889 RepID=A0A9D9GWZ5_9BACL|nr:methylated-DNA--[protein]-cysteine S-methyltransferase [Candidatus Onthovivens merdipullorum]
MTISSIYHSFLGDIILYCKDNALVGLKFIDQAKPSFKFVDDIIIDDEDLVIKKVKNYLNKYFSKQETNIDFEVNPIGSEFQKLVWSEVSCIPYGKTVSYSFIANELKNKLKVNSVSIRKVAQAISQNKILIIIPCHRVIGKDGSLKGYSGGLNRKASLLNLEKN